VWSGNDLGAFWGPRNATAWWYLKCALFYAHDLLLHAHPCLDRARRIFVYFVSPKNYRTSFQRPSLLAPGDIFPPGPTCRYWYRSGDINIPVDLRLSSTNTAVLSRHRSRWVLVPNTAVDSAAVVSTGHALSRLITPKWPTNLDERGCCWL